MSALWYRYLSNSHKCNTEIKQRVTTSWQFLTSRSRRVGTEAHVMVDLKSNEHTTKQKIASQKRRTREDSNQSFESIFHCFQTRAIYRSSQTNIGWTEEFFQTLGRLCNINQLYTWKETTKQGNSRRRLPCQDCRVGFSFLARFLEKMVFNQRKTSSPDPCAQEVFFFVARPQSPTFVRRRSCFSRGCRCFRAPVGFSRSCRYFLQVCRFFRGCVYLSWTVPFQKFACLHKMFV